MNPIRQSIDDERKTLNTQIKSAQDRLAKLDQLLALANDLFPEPQATVITPGTGVQQMGSATIQATGQIMTKRDLVLNTADQILADGVHRDSRALLPELEARGVAIGGSNPVNNLSAYLSAAKDRFESNRKKGGWMIKTVKKAKAAVSLKDSDRDELLN